MSSCNLWLSRKWNNCIEQSLLHRRHDLNMKYANNEKQSSFWQSENKSPLSSLANFLIRTHKNRKSQRSFVLLIPRHPISGKSTEQKKANKMLKAIKKTSESFIPYSVLHAQNVIPGMSRAFFPWAFNLGARLSYWFHVSYDGNHRCFREGLSADSISVLSIPYIYHWDYLLWFRKAAEGSYFCSFEIKAYSI